MTTHTPSTANDFISLTFEMGFIEFDHRGEFQNVYGALEPFAKEGVPLQLPAVLNALGGEGWLPVTQWTGAGLDGESPVWTWLLIRQLVPMFINNEEASI